MPPSVALRKEANDALEAVSRAGSESEVREIVDNINGRIREANRQGIPGPSLMLMPLDAEGVVREWRDRQAVEKPRQEKTG